jgi:hypothetical protein
MISPISSTPAAAPAAATTISATPVAPSKSPSPSAPHSSASIPVDTVHISSAARTAMQEAIETPAQTAQEASGGDHQAQMLLAKEQAVDSQWKQENWGDRVPGDA